MAKLSCSNSAIEVVVGSEGTSTTETFHKSYRRRPDGQGEQERWSWRSPWLLTSRELYGSHEIQREPGHKWNLAANDYEIRGTEERDQFGQIAPRFMATGPRTVLVVAARFVSSAYRKCLREKYRRTKKKKRDAKRGNVSRNIVHIDFKRYRCASGNKKLNIGSIADQFWKIAVDVGGYRRKC